MKTFKNLYDDLGAARTILQGVLKSSEDMTSVDSRELRDKVSEAEDLVVEAMREALILEVDREWTERTNDL
jgi:hypothetical protein